MKHTINTSGSWWYEDLWSEPFSLCKKLDIIYNIIICKKKHQANKEI